MTDAGWTRERPTNEGVYWFRNNENCESVVQVYRHMDDGWCMYGVEIEHCTIRSLERDEYDELTGCEWLGPISPDTYHQGRVAGLKEAEVIAQFMSMATPGNIAAALRFMADQLEQQAQGGGKR